MIDIQMMKDCAEYEHEQFDRHHGRGVDKCRVAGSKYLRRTRHEIINMYDITVKL